MLKKSKKFAVTSLLKENDTEHIEHKRGRFSVFKGLFLAILSGICYSIAAMVVKKLKNLDTGQLAVYRCIAVVAFSLPSTIKCQEDIFGPKDLRLLLVLRGICGGSTIFLGFIAFRYLPLGEAAVIIFSAPVFISVAARIILNEPCGIFQSITILLTIIGIVLITKLPLKLTSDSVTYTSESLYGIIAAIFSMLFSTSAFIVIRKVKGVHHSIITFINGLVSFIETLILNAIVGNFKWHDCHFEGFLIILLALVSYFSQLLLTMSLQCEMAGPVSTMRAGTDIMMGFLWQVLLFNDIPDALSISGAALVGFSVIFTSLKKWVQSLPPELPHLKYVGWMTK